MIFNSYKSLNCQLPWQLGVTFDENLTFNDLVKNVTTKISTSVGVMRLHCQLPADVIVKLYYSLVYSHLIYALLAWGRLGHTNAAMKIVLLSGSQESTQITHRL